MESAAVAVVTLTDGATMAGRIQRKKLTEEEESLIKGDLEKGIAMTMFRERAEPVVSLPQSVRYKTIRQRAEPPPVQVNVYVKVIMENRQVAWNVIMKTGTWTRPEKTNGVLDLHEIRELRRGENSKDFTIFYGSQFVLNTLSLGADKKEDAEKWLMGLELLRQETLEAPTPDIIESWLKKQMYSINQTMKNSIRLKELKSLLPQLNVKVTGARFDRFLEILLPSGVRKDVLDFKQFHEFYNILMFENQKSILEEFKDLCANKTDKNDAYAALLYAFQRFLLYQQNESWANDLNQVMELMKTFIDDTMSKTRFTVDEFLNFLFSKKNSIWNEKLSDVCNLDMNNPLSDYWINSSHNTYLTGDQLRSESSTEAYVRCLRLGCRCIELDCWEVKGEPVIYHGKTMTKKIKFKDVVEAINEHAFVASEYPLVLSIEEHCGRDQQKEMAQIFRDVFGDKLLTKPVELPTAKKLPSPTQLKGKIIIKHKTLSKASSGRGDLQKVEKQGDLYIWDAVDQQWNRHYSIISDDKLYYAEEYEEEEEEPRKGIRPTKLHYAEPWFHGLMSEGRQTAERLLREFCAESGGRDGTFLVWESNTVNTDYTLSLWRGGRVQHCQICSGSEDGHTMYFLTENLPFSSVYGLIEHYRQNPLHIEFDLRLTDAVPCPNQRLTQNWFYSNLSKWEAEDMLMRIPRDGAFLIRQRENSDSFAITFRGDGKVKHCRIQKEGSMFALGSSALFESLVELVNYFSKKPLYRKIKLRYPVTEELVTQFSKKKHSIYELKMYLEPNKIEPSLSTVKALEDYRAVGADELSFSKGAFILNVTKDTSSRWKGDYNGKLQHFFPANYVEEVSNNKKVESKDQGTEDNPLGVLCKGVVELSKCSVAKAQQAKYGKSYVLTLQLKDDDTMLPLDIATNTVEDQFEWYRVVWEAAQREINKITKQKEKKKDAPEEVQCGVQSRFGQQSFSSGEKSSDKKGTKTQGGKMVDVPIEMSELVVYCMPCKGKKDSFDYYTHEECRSFEEDKAPLERAKDFLKYNRKALSRIFPNGVQRVDSSNYDPFPYWLCGCHMVALNFQTGDKCMQLNSAFFSLNGQTGYVLQPEMMRSKSYHPYAQPDKIPKFIITVRVIAARHLPKPSQSIVSPFVEIELCGFNTKDYKFKTIIQDDNGLNPVWPAPPDPVKFLVYEPELTFLRFEVNEEDMFSDPNFLAQATFPVKGIQSGYRSVPLKNGFSETIELASLLVYIDKEPVRMKDKKIDNSRFHS